VTQGPLAGIRVVEAGRFAAAPSCATVLADWGADVIKLEPPDGDPARGPGSRAVGEHRVNPRFDVHNRSRRSVALDLTTESGRGDAHRLVATADVFVTNMRPSALVRLGLDIATLRGAHPRLIYAQVTGYGLDDPDERPSYDHGAFWSFSGMADLFRDGSGTPPQPAGGMGDRATGAVLAGGVSAALFRRERTGDGDHVAVSLLRTAMWLMASDVADALRDPDADRPVDRKAASIPTVNCFRCRDGEWIWLQSMHPDQDWDRLLAAIDAQWLDDDPRFRGGDPHKLAASRTQFVETLDEIFRKHTAAEWYRRLSDADLVVAPVQRLAAAVRDPLVAASGALRTMNAPDGTPYLTVNSPCGFGTDLAEGAPAPRMGADTAAVLAELRQV